MPPILDTAIGTVFVFLLFSLVLSALNELILSRFDQRAKFLHMGMQELFGEPNRAWRQKHWLKTFGGLSTRVGLGTWTRKLYEHGLINALSRTDSADSADGTSPSYIPAGAFVTALLDLISKPSSSAPAIAATPAPTPNGRGFVQNIIKQLLAWLEKQRDPQPSPPDPAKLAQSLRDTATALGAVVKAWPQSDPTQPDALQAKITAAGTDAAKLLAVAQEVQGALFLGAGTEHTSANIETWINNLAGSPQLQQSLRSLFVSVGKDVDRFKMALEGWFNAAMDRVTGWYKRFAQKWMIVIGFILAAILNVDTLRIVRELSKNPNLAKAVAAQAESYGKGGYRATKTQAERHAEIEKATATEEKTLDSAKITEEAARVATPLDPAKLATAAQARRVAQDALDKKKDVLLMEAGDDAAAAYNKSISDLQKTGIPMGWNDQDQRRMLGLSEIYGPLPKDGFWSKLLHYPWVYTVSFWEHCWQFLPLIFGWFLTALAASLGAPFWFDTLSRVVNIRNAGRPPGKEDATSTATKPPPATLDKALTK